jgi:hypothetical protein
MKCCLILLMTTAILHSDILYQTDFEEFSVGLNQWGMGEGWSSNDNTSGAQSIDDDVLPALLKTASLGFTRPGSTFTTVALELGYDPTATGLPVVQIDTLVGIEDSTNNRRDDFFVTFYNTAGQRLARIRFDNQSIDAFETQFGIWREDSNTQFDTQVDFVHGEIFPLFATIDLENNTWTADFGGIPLFEDAQFTNRAGPITLGFLAYEWDLTAPFPDFHGDNFLLVADLTVRTVNTIPVPETTSSFDATGTINLTWQTEPGYIDQVQFSDDLETWEDTLPDSTFDNVTTSETVNFTDSTGNLPGIRYYRVRRTPDL